MRAAMKHILCEDRHKYEIRHTGEAHKAEENEDVFYWCEAEGIGKTLF